MWKELFKNTEKLTNMFSFKSASILGRPILVNYVIEPKLIYPASVVDQPKEPIKKYKTLTRSFVLREGNAEIKHNMLIQERKKRWSQFA